MFNMISLFNAVSTDETLDVQNDSDPLPGSEVTHISDQDPANKAIVTSTIKPGELGQVKFQGTWWNAHCEQNITLLPEQEVYVIGESSSIPLLVEPAHLPSDRHLQDAA